MDWYNGLAVRLTSHNQVRAGLPDFDASELAEALPDITRGQLLSNLLDTLLPNLVDTCDSEAAGEAPGDH